MKKLNVPKKLVLVALTALAGCAGSGTDHPQNLCPPDYYCSSDAARAFNCTDASSSPFQSDLGSCYPPV